MANVKTQARIDVDLSMEAVEAKALLDHLQATTTKDSNNDVLALAQALDLAINGKPKVERGPRKSAEEKAAAKAAKAKEKADKAAAAAQSDKPAPAPAPVETKATAAPAVEKKKVTVPA